MTAGTEKRKIPRRLISYPALIDLDDGLPPRHCALCDISQQGAKLMVGQLGELPERFILILSSQGNVRRRCRVRWKNEQEIGVEFLPEPKKRPRMPLRLQIDFPPPAPAEGALDSKSVLHENSGGCSKSLGSGNGE